MNNKITLERPLRRRLRLAMIMFLIFTVTCVVLLLITRSIANNYYSGQIDEVVGTVKAINYKDDENGVEIVLDNGKTYNANLAYRFGESIDFETLVGQTVTLVIPQKKSVGDTMVLGIKQGEQVVVDYEKVISAGKAENRDTMIVLGIISGCLFAIACALYVWRMFISPATEKELYKAYCEYSVQRQPSCPEYKKLGTYVVAFLAYTIVYSITLSLIGSLVENDAVLIAVGVSLTCIFVAAIVGLFAVLAWVIKKERAFYATNFPFDFTDVSHIAMRKKFKEQLQAELNAERERHPHRYGDGGNGYTVDFTESGLKLYDFEPMENYADIPTTEDVFGVQDAESDTRSLVCTIDYQTLNFEALPFYRKKDHPFAVVIKSRLEKTTDLPNEMVNDIHIILDSNLLATLRHFDVPVENLQYILDNKQQLIAENCAGNKNKANAK